MSTPDMFLKPQLANSFGAMQPKLPTLSLGGITAAPEEKFGPALPTFGFGARDYKNMTPDAVIMANVGNVKEFTRVRAGFRAVAAAEGTLGKGDDGFNVAMGGTLFNNNYADHPHKSAAFRDKNGHRSHSDAAGQLQIMGKTYQRIIAQHHMPRDFHPGTQYAIGIKLVQEKPGAWEALKAGQFDKFTHKVNGIWASLPGSPYHQHTVSKGELHQAYLAQGGDDTGGRGPVAVADNGRHPSAWHQRHAGKPHGHGGFHAMRAEAGAAPYHHKPHSEPQAAPKGKAAVAPKGQGVNPVRLGAEGFGFSM